MKDMRFYELEKISGIPGNYPEYVQGGGGNTSVKIDDSLMAVKASGYQLKQINTSEGFVVVDYIKIREYFDKVDLDSGIDYEKDVISFTKNQVQKIEGLKDLRPSVEAGFHAVLKKYVIHTHPVYANLLCCSSKGKEMADRIFQGIDFLWISYINPGFFLTVKIKEALEKAFGEGKDPKILFMENHGLIVHSDDLEECLELHEYVNNTIKDYFMIKDAYPLTGPEKIAEDRYISRCDYLKDYFLNNEIPDDFFEKNCLYPDQLVYLNDNVTFSKNGSGSLFIDRDNSEVEYRAKYLQAVTMEETLLACIYVIDNVNIFNPPVKSMSESEIDYIRNWESEKYRKTVNKT